MKKHIITHIHCLDHPGVLKIVNTIIKHNKIFDGHKIATLSHSNKELEVFNLITDILEYEGFEVIPVQNNDLRETGHFYNTSLPALLEKTKTGLLYYCHSKGISYHPDSEDGKATSLWTDVLVENTLEKISSIPFDNYKFDTFGSCKVAEKGFLPDNIGENFSYVGTFFWVRIEKLIDKDFDPTSKFYLEALPGLITTSIRGFNIGPTFKKGESPYKLSTWAKKGYSYNDI